MFIYKITVIPINKIYIGFDSKPEYKKTRWKFHCKVMGSSNKKVHKIMRKYGLENCKYEVIETGFSSIGKLAIREIELIEFYDSFKNGLNSSLGGDGIGKHELHLLSEDEINILKTSLGEHWSSYNKKYWSNTTFDQRQEMTSHLHTKEVIEKRSNTLKEYYDQVPGAKEKHTAGIKKWQKENPEQAKKNRIANGLKGAAKTSKKVTVIREDGTEEMYNSISELQRSTGQWMSTLREKTKRDEFHNGYKLKNN